MRKVIANTALIALLAMCATDVSGQNGATAESSVVSATDSVTKVINGGFIRPTKQQQYENASEQKRLVLADSIDVKKLFDATSGGENEIWDDWDKPQEKKSSGFINISSSKMQGHWGGIGLGYVGFIECLGGMKLPKEASYLSQNFLSPSLTINFLDYSLLKSKHVLLITGLGLEVNNFHFSRNITLHKDADGMTVPVDLGDEVSKSKLVTAYLNVPLLVEFQFGKKNNFFINAGGVIGVKVNSHTKYKSGSNNSVTKLKDHLNIRDFHYGFTANIGYSHFGISATYYPVSVFRENRGPQVQQGSVGLMFYF